VRIARTSETKAISHSISLREWMSTCAFGSGHLATMSSYGRSPIADQSSSVMKGISG
jgi:hypothetical protein